MTNNKIIIIIIVLIVLIGSIVFLLRKKHNREGFQAVSGCSSSLTIEPEGIVVGSKQPTMFRYYVDGPNNQANISFLTPDQVDHPSSICNWFQAGSIVNVNYNTTVVSQGSIGGTSFGLQYFYLTINFANLPLFTPTTNVIGQGVYTMIGYGKQLLLRDANYKVLQNGTVAIRKDTSDKSKPNLIGLSGVQHYPGPGYYYSDPGNQWYTYDVNVQFSYNI